MPVMSKDVYDSSDPQDRAPTPRGPNTAIAGSRGPRTIRLQPSDTASLRPRGLERRATRRALQDWQRLCSGGELPSLGELGPHRNPTDWAERFLLSCDLDAARSVFVLCGEHVESAFGQRLIGRALNDIASDRPALIGACRDSLREQAPVEIEDAFRLPHGRLMLYRALFMPVRGLDVDDRYLMGAYGSIPFHG